MSLSGSLNLDVKGQLFVVARCRGGGYFLYTRVILWSGAGACTLLMRRHGTALYKVELQMFSFLWASLSLSLSVIQSLACYII